MPIRVVLADDHVLVRQGLKSLLEREEFKVVAEASDGQEAVRQVEWLLRDKGVRTLCVHGDNPQALAFVRELRRHLEQRGVMIRPF